MTYSTTIEHGHIRNQLLTQNLALGKTRDSKTRFQEVLVDGLLPIWGLFLSHNAFYEINDLFQLDIVFAAVS